MDFDQPAHLLRRGHDGLRRREHGQPRSSTTRWRRERRPTTTVRPACGSAAWAPHRLRAAVRSGQILFSRVHRRREQGALRSRRSHAHRASSPRGSGSTTTPIPVIIDGRIVWIIDGYTWSDEYPYSEPFGGRELHAQLGEGHQSTPTTARRRSTRSTRTTRSSRRGARSSRPDRRRRSRCPTRSRPTSATRRTCSASRPRSTRTTT